MTADHMRADGSYRASEGRKKRTVIAAQLDRIDFTDLSRLDSHAIHAVIELLGAVASRQGGYEYTPSKRPGRWGRIEADEVMHTSNMGERTRDTMAQKRTPPAVLGGPANGVLEQKEAAHV